MLPRLERVVDSQVFREVSNLLRMEMAALSIGIIPLRLSVFLTARECDFRCQDASDTMDCTIDTAGKSPLNWKKVVLTSATIEDWSRRAVETTAGMVIANDITIQTTSGSCNGL